MKTKLLGLCMVAAAGFLAYTNFKALPVVFRTPAQSLRAQIEFDVEDSLIRSGIPKSNGIHHIDIKYRSENAHKILQKDQPSFATSKNGKIWLEIELIDLPDTKSPAIIAQTSVFDTKTNNKISEFAQTYGFKQYNLEANSTNSLKR